MTRPPSNYYHALGLNSSATQDEIRRAYRILARRYHPDVNPGKSSEDKFKVIAEAYETLSDPAKRSQYDIEFQAELKRHGDPRVRAYEKAAGAAQRRFRQAQEARQAAEGFRSTKSSARPPAFEIPTNPFSEVGKTFEGIRSRVSRSLGAMLGKHSGEKKPPHGAQQVSRLSVIEVSVNMHDAILGVRRTVEIAEPEGSRKISIQVPPGSRSGAVLRFRDKGGSGEELVCVLRVASHPFLSIEAKGLIVEVPVTINEAFSGASISLPTLDEQVIVKIPAGSQSGTEIRVKGKGVPLKDGTFGDLFYRLMIKLPESTHAVGLTEKLKDIESYYAQTVRHQFPKSLRDVA